MGTVYNIDFERGALVPLENPGLPVGQIISYEDRANPRREFVVVADHIGAGAYHQEQDAVCLDDGHRAQISMAGGKLCGNWRIENRIITGLEMEQALAAAYANGAKLKAEMEAESTRKADAARLQRVDWEKKYTWLERVKPGGYASAALGSKNLKRELSRAFPGVKFSVTSDTFAGGDSISIHWELGPTTKEVEAISNKYQEGSFDGMEDLYNYDHSNHWPEMFGGAKYVQESRDEGEAIYVVALALCKEWNLTPPEDGRSFWNIRRLDDDRGHDLGVIARQLLFAQSYPVGSVITGIEHTDQQAGQWTDLLRVTFTAPEQPTAQPVTAATITKATVSENKEKGGVEIRFPSKPEGNILEALKSHGWRWSRFAGCWYKRADEKTLAWAKALIGQGGTAEAA